MVHLRLACREVQSRFAWLEGATVRDAKGHRPDHEVGLEQKSSAKLYCVSAQGAVRSPCTKLCPKAQM